MLWIFRTCMYDSICTGVGKRLHTLTSHPTLDEVPGFSWGTLTSQHSAKKVTVPPNCKVQRRSEQNVHCHPQIIHRSSTDHPQIINRPSTDHPQLIHRSSTESVIRADDRCPRKKYFQCACIWWMQVRCPVSLYSCNTIESPVCLYSSNIIKLVVCLRVFL